MARILASLFNDLVKQSESKTSYTVATFQYTRIVDGHSVETLPAHVLDLRISHRFGPLSNGLYNFFGLDNATMRLGFDYGIANNFMVGVGHSTFQKTYDAFLKFKILRQSAGEVNMPVSVSFLATGAISSLRPRIFILKSIRDRVSSSGLCVSTITCKENFRAFLLTDYATFIHADNISFTHTKRNILAIGFAGRHEISKRISVNAEYYYQLPDTKSPGSHNVLSFGIDIGTGGHVFQLHFTNSTGLVEKSFISETTGRWDNGDVLFGFNISRVFQLGKKHKADRY